MLERICPEYRRPIQQRACCFLERVLLALIEETQYLGWTEDHKGQILESYVNKVGDRQIALKFPRKPVNWHGQPHVIMTDKLRFQGSSMTIIGNIRKQEAGRLIDNRVENSHLPFW